MGVTQRHDTIIKLNRGDKVIGQIKTSRPATISQLKAEISSSRRLSLTSIVCSRADPRLLQPRKGELMNANCSFGADLYVEINYPEIIYILIELTPIIIILYVV